MARLARVVVPTVPHHVTQRGNRRQQTFLRDDDYRIYLYLLAECAKAAETAVWAYCLMPNHVHLILVPEDEDGLRATLAVTHGRYAKWVNDREGWRGHLWQDRFGSFPMDDAYLLRAARYIELNPVRAGLVAAAGDWPWSSARARLEAAPDPVLSPGPLDDMVDDWAAFLEEALADDTAAQLRRHERTGRPLGSDSFLRDLEARTGRRLRALPPGPRKIGDSH